MGLYKYTVPLLYTMLHELKNTAAVSVSAYILLTGVRSEEDREKIDTIIITTDYNYLLQVTTDYNYLLPQSGAGTNGGGLHSDSSFPLLITGRHKEVAR
jgi:hypothetical protein